MSETSRGPRRLDYIRKHKFAKFRRGPRRNVYIYIYIYMFYSFIYLFIHLLFICFDIYIYTHIYRERDTYI